LSSLKEFQLASLVDLMRFCDHIKRTIKKIGGVKAVLIDK
jgi:hypothetical protein